ncbi:hypothetical protein QJS04_geneDACA014623 [Acorus gramineus]|uniref:SOSEKI DIX-like domain-containing protein n=1 Tax=Acorus gramineus TaxID=55184 RepID=A0AAV9AT43_ACOGR|nr:hypothetical protein QJS04_geneDACA014623 [Acorus gramineus]
MDASGGEVRRINVVYFLSRMGKIDHPHLIRVHHLHRKGVRLRDVKRWMSSLRGKDFPDSFAWKYKSGYVWQDLLEDDIITPVSDNEYVLKGSLITTSISPSNHDEIKRTVRIEGGESEGSGSESNPPSSDASTQTDESSKVVFRMEGRDRTVEKKKGEDRTANKVGRRKSSSSHVLNSLLTCRIVETNDAAVTRIRRSGGESDHQRPSNHASSGGRKSRRSEESERLMRSVPAAYKPVSVPKCS